jgi:hypothetical protein
MSDQDSSTKRAGIVLPPGEGRSYPMGRISAVFKSFVLAPAGVTHDFENRTSSRAGVLNFSIPGDFEKNMPAIAEYFAENPPKDA